MLALLAALLVQVDDRELDRLLEQLGDPSPAVRERASDDLEDRGPAVVPKLLTAVRHSDAEVRIRAKEILSRRNPSLFLDELRTVQRAVKFRIPENPDPLWPNPVAIEGTWFTFSRLHFTKHSAVVGSILYTSATPTDEGDLRWDIVSVTADTDRLIERCGTCSPSKVFVRGDPPGPCVIRIRGTRRWTCSVPVTFRNPAPGDQRRVGPYTVSLKWPCLEISDGVPPLSSKDLPIRLRFVLKPGRGTPPAPPPTMESDLDPAIFFPEVKETEEPSDPNRWCECPVPKTGVDAPPAEGKLLSTKVHVGKWETVPLEDLASISLIFPLPVEESFEVTSPPVH